MGVEDDHDYSFYRRGVSPTIRRTRKPMARTDSKPSRNRPPPEGLPSLRTEVKRMLAANPDMTLDDIMRRLKRYEEFTVSRISVSAIMTEFRHTCRILREAGLLK